MKETSYSDTVTPSNNRREFLYEQHLRCTEQHPMTNSHDICRGKVFPVGGPFREGLYRASAGRRTPGL